MMGPKLNSNPAWDRLVPRFSCTSSAETFAAYMIFRFSAKVAHCCWRGSGKESAMVMYSALLKLGAQDDDFILAVVLHEPPLIGREQEFSLWRRRRADDSWKPRTWDEKKRGARRNKGREGARSKKKQRARKSQEKAEGKKGKILCFYPTRPYLKLSLSVLPSISPAPPFFQTWLAYSSGLVHPDSMIL